MSWAYDYIVHLRKGMFTQLRPTLTINAELNGKLVTLAPIKAWMDLEVGDVVLGTTVEGKDLLATIEARSESEGQPEQLKFGGAWVNRDRICGRVLKVEP